MARKMTTVKCWGFRVPFSEPIAPAAKVSKATPHVRMDVTVFVCSDETGLECAIKASGVTPIEGDVIFTEEKIAELTAGAVASANGLGAVRDFRAMTGPEVTAYLRSQEDREPDEDEEL